jgi:polycomb protein EED
MDNTIKIWSLEDEALQQSIENSYTHGRDETSAARGAFETVFVQFPMFSTHKVHADYVDCVQWVGNLLLSKSTSNKVVLWKPNAARRKDAVTILRELSFSDCGLWFIRFSTDSTKTKIAVGNQTGKVFVWDIDGSPPQCNVLKVPQCKITVRQTAFSPDGRTLLYCCENGTIWRWDKAQATTAQVQSTTAAN